MFTIYIPNISDGNRASETYFYVGIIRKSLRQRICSIIISNSVTECLHSVHAIK